MTVTISEATWNELLEARAALGRLNELAAKSPLDNGCERHALEVEELDSGTRLATALQFYPSLEDAERSKNSHCLAWRPTDGVLMRVTRKVTRTRTRMVTRYR